jgi:small neutral amino acid transporter SnatA (MarC family)
MHIFGGFGFIMAFVGTLITIYLIVERIFYNVGLTDRPLFIMGFFLIVLGIQFLATGIIADILMKIYYGQSDRKNYLIEKILE